MSRPPSSSATARKNLPRETSSNNNIVSLGAETYYYTVGGGSNVVSGSGYGAEHHQPDSDLGLSRSDTPRTPAASPCTIRPRSVNPLSPTTNQPVDIWVKVGYQLQINTCYIYYTTDGSNPEGAFGIGKGTTQVMPGVYVNHDSADSNIDWWKGTIPGPAGRHAGALQGGAVQRRQLRLLHRQSHQPAEHPADLRCRNHPAPNCWHRRRRPSPISIPPRPSVWLHNDLNPANTVTGLQSGFHILRARTFLPRPGQSSVYNTFSQTFYYDGALPTGVIAFPANGDDRWAAAPTPWWCAPTAR